MNTDWTRKARDSEGEKYLEKAIRLDKYLADVGKGTRTELKEMIRRGRITVNGGMGVRYFLACVVVFDWHVR